MKTYKNNKAFTLVEMLVVIAIIGILAGMIIPSLRRARETARKVKCASNIRQLYLATISYANDNNGSIPNAYSSEDYDMISGVWKGHNGWVTWYKYKSHKNSYGDNPPDELRTYWWGDKGEDCIRNGLLYPYMGGDIRTYICPDFKRFLEHDPEVTQDNPDYKTGTRSYLMNSKLRWQSMFKLQASANGMSRRMMFAEAAYDNKKTYKDKDGNAVKADWGLRDDGANIIIHYDRYHKEAPIHCYFRGCDGALEYEDDQKDKQKELIGGWHHGKGNVVFLDGHVECIDPGLTRDVYYGDYTPQ